MSTFQPAPLLEDMEDYERSIMAAHGYLELGMYKNVWQELEGLPSEVLSRIDVLEILTLSLMGEKRWEDALKIARRLREQAPEEASGYIHEAYCMHEMGNTREALDILLDGPKSLLDKSVFFYNAGCYHARLGDLESAVAMLEKSFKLDSNLRKSARRDPDLINLKEML